MSQHGSEGDRQERIFSNLHDRSPKLAGIYRTAIRALEVAPDPDCEASRVSVICHCMRELMNGLPSVMADTTIPRPKPSSGGLLAQLPELLAAHPQLDLEAQQDVLPVPSAVAMHVSSLARARAQETGRNRSIAASLLTGTVDAKHPAIEQWLAAQGFFLGWTHLDRNHDGDRDLPTDDELRQVIAVVEDVVEVRTAAFFDNLRSIDDLLADINATFNEVD